MVTLNIPVQEMIDLTFIDELIARTGRGREAAIPILQGIQTHYRYLPDAALTRVCELTDITPAQSAAGLVAQCQALTLDKTGGFFNYDGKPLPL